MKKNDITEDERYQFAHIPTSKKIDCMQLYLIGEGGRKFNMQEVGGYVFGDQNYSYTVSLIHRCYNFAGQNGGRYRNGCRFEQEYGYRVSRKDIENFVRSYPNGTFENGVTFEDFLKIQLLQLKQQSNRSNSQQSYIEPARMEFDHQDFQQNSNYNIDQNYHTDVDMRRICLIMGVIGVLVLIFMFATGQLLKHWVISLIALLCAWTGFTER